MVEVMTISPLHELGRAGLLDLGEGRAAGAVAILDADELAGIVARLRKLRELDVAGDDAALVGQRVGLELPRAGNVERASCCAVMGRAPRHTNGEDGGEAEGSNVLHAVPAMMLPDQLDVAPEARLEVALLVIVLAVHLGLVVRQLQDEVVGEVPVFRDMGTTGRRSSTLSTLDFTATCLPMRCAVQDCCTLMYRLPLSFPQICSDTNMQV